MKPLLPAIFIMLAALMLLAAISFLWRAFRALFGGEEQSDLGQSAAMRQRTELLDEKDAVLRSLKDLEFEHQAGKISDDDFKRLDGEARARARRILKLLDKDLKEHRDKAKALIAQELEGAGKSA